MPAASMRAVSGSWHLLNLQMIGGKENIKQVTPALRLPAGR